MAVKSKIRLDYILSKGDIDKLINFTKTNKKHNAKVDGGAHDNNRKGRDDEDIRKTYNYHFNFKVNDWRQELTKKFEDYIGEDNLSVNQYDLLEYGKGCHFKVHTDSQGKEGVDINRSGRVWSSSTMVDCTDNLEGGDLIIYGPRFGNTTRTIRLEKGQTVFFPSNYFHKVTPVTKGRRTVLVTWLGVGENQINQRFAMERELESGRLTIL